MYYAVVPVFVSCLYRLLRWLVLSSHDLDLTSPPDHGKKYSLPSSDLLGFSLSLRDSRLLPWQ